jgi:hypothetical protein
MIIPTLRTDRKEFTDGRFNRVPRVFLKAGWVFKLRGATEGARESPCHVVRGYAQEFHKEGWNRSLTISAGPLESDMQFNQWVKDFIKANKLGEERMGTKEYDVTLLIATTKTYRVRAGSRAEAERKAWAEHDGGCDADQESTDHEVVECSEVSQSEAKGDESGSKEF